MLTRRLYLLLPLFICLCAQTGHAKTLTGDGYGETKEAARNEALTTLASSIFVHIESSTQSYQDNKGANLFNSVAQTSTNLPLFSVNFDCYNMDNQIFCSATMDTQAALPLYQNKINDLLKSLNERTLRVDQLPKTQRYTELQKILSDYEQFAKYSTVLLYLSGKNDVITLPTISRQDIQKRLASLENNVASLELAAKLLARDINATSLHIKPPAVSNSREVTPFATALWQSLIKELSSTNNPADADYHYSGQYQVHDKGMRVSYVLNDRQGNTQKAHVIELHPNSYKHLRSTASAPDFDALLHKGYAVSSEFKAQINTNKGRSQILFEQGDIAQLLVKLNKAGYFYIVGHSKNSHSEMSYLLDLNEANDNRRFIYYINADDVNKWVSLGEFEVEEPFGIESLQLIASPKDLVDKLPRHYYDNDSGYYVVSTNIEEGAAITRKTRSFKRVKNKTVSETAEAVLLFTTQE